MKQETFHRSLSGIERRALMGSSDLFIHNVLTSAVNRTWQQKVLALTVCLIAGHKDAAITVTRSIHNGPPIYSSRRTFCDRCRCMLRVTERTA